jgi:hypothetical protein
MPTASKARYPRGTVLRCPSCGQQVTLAVGANALECNATHNSVQMKEVK